MAPTGNGFAGHAFVTASTTPSAVPGKNQDPCNKTGDPILQATGTKVETYPLFSVPGEMGLNYVLYLTNGSWYDNFSSSLDTTCVINPPDNGACKVTTLHRADGSTIIFTGGPTATSYTEQNSSVNGLATLTRDPVSGRYTVHDEDATTQVYSSSGGLLSIMDASGVGWTISSSGNLETVTHTNGKSFTIAHGTATQTTVNGAIVWLETDTVTDPAGNAYTVNYNNWAVSRIVYPGSPSTVISFAYTSFGSAPYGSRLSEVDYNGTPYSYTTYVMDGTNPNYEWANGTHLADGSMNVVIGYKSLNNGTMSVTITNPLGHQTTQSYDSILYSGKPGGVSNARLTLTSDAAVVTCGGTTQGRTYDSNNHLAATIDNNGNAHTYTYAANGQLQTETEAYGTPQARKTDYVWDANQQLNRLLSATVEGWRKTAYIYNAQNRIASVTVTNLSANGSANQSLTTTYGYSLSGNGMVQAMTVTRPSPNGSDTVTSKYDALGHLTSVSNGLGQTTTYGNYNGLGLVGHVVGPNGDATDYTYDARGRVVTKTTYPNGTAATWSYTYDGFGLPHTQASPDGQVTTWNRDPSSMRVTSITHNDKDGTSTESFSYDANGDVLEHKVARGSTVGLDQLFTYDALGRLYQSVGRNGQLQTYAYDGNGNTLSVADATGHTVAYQYDALNRITQKTESGGASPAMPATAPTLNVPSTSATGAYTVSWNSITGATFYVLQEQVSGGSWSTVQSSSAVTWQATNRATNTYRYQVKACNATGCGPWSSAGSISVTIPAAPTSAPSLTVPSTSANGNYTASWTSVANTSAYTLQQQVNGGTWTTVQNNTSLSWSVTGKTNGTYAYRVQACNAVGCGPWSATGTTVVTWPPVPATPVMTVPAFSLSANFTISWTAVSGATSYYLTTQPNGGAWAYLTSISSSSLATSVGSSGTYAYAVEACNISGCSAWSNTPTVTVTIPAPIGINGQTYSGTNSLKSGSGNEGIGFDLANGTTWEVFHTTPGNTHVVNASGPIPFGAATVQYTWTDAGVLPGMNDAKGSITTNGASSRVAVTSNPSTEYVTAAFNYNSANNAHEYNLRVDFFNAAGQNISSSTCLLIGQVVGNQ